MDTRDLAAAYLLGELDEHEAAEVDRRLGSDAAFQAEVEGMRPLLADLEQLPAEAWPAAPAPLTVAAEVPAAKPAPRRRLWSLRPAVALAALIAALLVGGLAGTLLDDEGEGGGSEPAPALTLEPLSTASAARGEVAMPKPDEMVLTVSDLPPSQQGQYYELWLLDGAEQTVPVASFRVGANGTASLRVPLPADPAGYRYFDVSRQHAAQGTEHSADSVLRGPTSPS